VHCASLGWPRGLGRSRRGPELTTEIEGEEIADLGNGVTYAIVLQRGRPAGSNGEVRVRSATVGLWDNGLLTRVTNYPDIDAARADAERLVRERK
jgi:hypothetical protein